MSDLNEEMAENLTSLASVETGSLSLPWRVCWQMLAIAVSSKKYDARSRALIR